MKLIGTALALALLASTATAGEFEFKGLTAQSTPASLDGKTSEPCELVPNSPTGDTQTVCVLSPEFLPTVANQPVLFAGASFDDRGMTNLIVSLKEDAYWHLVSAFIGKYGSICSNSYLASKWCFPDADLLLYVDKGETKVAYIYKKAPPVERVANDF
jgi:hypothetical protein